MKKILISAVILFTAFSCVSEENEENKGSAIVKVQTNVVRYATDITDDGIENFIEADQPDSHVNYLIEYNSEAKQVLFSVLNVDRPNFVTTYKVVAVKDGNITVESAGTASVFRFISDKEVNQIVKVVKGEQKIRYIYK